MKRFMCHMLLLVVLTSWLSICVSAAPEQDYPTGISGEAVWTLKGDTMYITGQGILSGVSNADCQPWEFFQDQIRHVVVEEGVTLIGDTIFAHTYNLETVTIAESVTEICEGAFRNCYALKTVALPANLQALGDFAFAYCEKLEHVELPDSLTKMGGSVFTGCTSLSGVRLSNHLYDIQQMNFDSCSSLSEVTIPAGVGFLRHASFSNCFNLKKVVFQGDQPHTNGDPFYMAPSDLVVYCYSDAKGWDDSLFYTYPVVKLERTAQPPAKDSENEPSGSSEHTAGAQPKDTAGETPPVKPPVAPDAIPGTAASDGVPVSPSGSASDLPATAEDAVVKEAEPALENRSTPPALLWSAVLLPAGCVCFALVRKKSEKKR